MKEAIETRNPLGPANRLTNKAGVADFFEVSVPTVDAWLRRGCPYVERGSRGKQWVLDLLLVARWRFEGDQELSPDPEQMDSKNRLDWYRGNRERTRHFEEIGKLIPDTKFEAELSATLKVVAVTLDSLSDVLERDAGITGVAAERVQIISDRMREKIYRRILELEVKDAA